MHAKSLWHLYVREKRPGALCDNASRRFALLQLGWQRDRSVHAVWVGSTDQLQRHTLLRGCDGVVEATNEGCRFRPEN